MNRAIAGETVRLLPDRAIFRPAARSLYVADTHFGKAAAFRARGVPVPEGGTSRDLQRLNALLRETGAERLVVLGDLLHDRAGRTADVLDAIRRWRREHDRLDVMLVRGNHDRSAGDPPDDLRIRCVNEPHPDHPFDLRHDPERDNAHALPGSACALAGHLHPAVRLGGSGKRALGRLPCFLISDRCVVLPAFGSFTGTHPVRPREGEAVVAIADGELIDVPRALIAGG